LKLHGLNLSSEQGQVKQQKKKNKQTNSHSLLCVVL
jgi:hypothetical protein